MGTFAARHMVRMLQLPCHARLPYRSFAYRLACVSLYARFMPTVGVLGSLGKCGQVINQRPNVGTNRMHRSFDYSYGKVHER